MFENLRQFRKTYLSYTMWVPLTVLVLFILVVLPDQYVQHYNDIVLMLAPLVSIFLCGNLLWKHKEFKHRNIVKLFIVFLVLFFLGETTWAILQYLGLEPFPSIADAFWILGYIPLIIAIIAAGRMKKSEGLVIPRQKVILFEVAWVVIMGAVIAYLIRGAMEWVEAPLEMFVYLAYPVLDGIVILLIISIFYLYRRRGLRFYWLFITIGILGQSFGDILFFMLDTAGKYTPGSLPDIFFMISYSAFGLGFLLLTKTIQGDEAHNEKIDTTLKRSIRQSAQFSAMSIIGLGGLIITQEIVENYVASAAFKNSLVGAVAVAVALSLVVGIFRVGVIEKKRYQRKRAENVSQYRKSLTELLEDRHLSEREDKILSHLRESLDVTQEEHDQMKEQILSKMNIPKKKE